MIAGETINQHETTWIRNIIFVTLAILVFASSVDSVSPAFAQLVSANFDAVDNYLSWKTKALGIPGAALMQSFANNWYLIFTLYLPALFTSYLVNPIGEETGWAGFALPHLQRRFHPWLAAAILVFIWAIWHLPGFFIPSEMGAFRPVNFIFFVLSSIFIRIVWTDLGHKQRARKRHHRDFAPRFEQYSQPGSDSEFAARAYTRSNGCFRVAPPGIYVPHLLCAASVHTRTSFISREIEIATTVSEQPHSGWCGSFGSHGVHP